MTNPSDDDKPAVDAALEPSRDGDAERAMDLGMNEAERRNTVAIDAMAARAIARADRPREARGELAREESAAGADGPATRTPGHRPRRARALYIAAGAGISMLLLGLAARIGSTGSPEVASGAADGSAPPLAPAPVTAHESMDVKGSVEASEAERSTKPTDPVARSPAAEGKGSERGSSPSAAVPAITPSPGKVPVAGGAAGGRAPVSSAAPGGEALQPQLPLFLLPDPPAKETQKSRGATSTPRD